MARKITMFELHFDGAQFGPSSVDPHLGGKETSEREDDEYVSDTEAEGDSGSRSVGRLVVASLAVSLVISLLARRLARRWNAEEPDESAAIEEVDAGGEPAVQ